MLHFFIVEDNANDAELTRLFIRHEYPDSVSSTITTEDELNNMLRDFGDRVSVVLSDYNMPAFTGLVWPKALEMVRQYAIDHNRTIPFIVLSGYGSADDYGKMALRDGADFYARKGEENEADLKSKIDLALRMGTSAEKKDKALRDLKQISNSGV